VPVSPVCCGGVGPLVLIVIWSSKTFGSARLGFAQRPHFGIGQDGVPCRTRCTRWAPTMRLGAGGGRSARLVAGPMGARKAAAFRTRRATTSEDALWSQARSHDEVGVVSRAVPGSLSPSGSSRVSQVSFRQRSFPFRSPKAATVRRAAARFRTAPRFAERPRGVARSPNPPLVGCVGATDVAAFARGN
jgi:hypothetical protein